MHARSSTVLVIIAVVGTAIAAAARPAHPGDAQAKTSSALAKVAFLAGHWQGRMGGDVIEEFWTRPGGKAMLGTFRWIGANGSTRVVEILTIVEQDDEVILRLRHFDLALKPWASEETPPTLRLAEATKNRAAFVSDDASDLAGVVYEVEDDELVITVSFKDAGRAPLVLPLSRGGL